MARPPAMTVDEAEKELGPREAFKINAANKSLVRKWASAQGYKSNVTYRLSNEELETFYRTGNYPMTAIDNVAPVTRNDIPVPAAVIASMPTDIRPTPVAAPDANEQLAAAIRAIAGGAVDANKVNALIDARAAELLATVAEMIADIPPAVQTTRLEIKIGDKVATVEGLSHEITPDVLTASAIGDNVMLIGPAGCGKTTIGQSVANALGLPFYVTSTVFDTHELMGFVDGHGRYHSTAFRKAFQNGGVWVADEIDAWDATALLAANSALANGFATFPDSDDLVFKHADFRVIATANTFGHGADRVYVGRNELDAATLDRFATIAMDYDLKLEDALSVNADWTARVRRVRAAARKANVRAVISTRAILRGQAALAAGMTRAKVEEIYLFKGMSKSDRDTVNRNIGA